MPKVNPEILSWAREQAGLDLAEAAQKIGLSDNQQLTKAEKLAAFEAGEKQPSRANLREISRVYHRPLLTFYLEKRPQKLDRGEDFRSLQPDLDPKEDYLASVLVREIKAAQSIVRQALIDEDEAPDLSMLGAFSIQDKPEKVAHAITQFIDFDLSAYRSKPDREKAFKYLRELVEGKGIFVLLQGNLGNYRTDIGLNVFRGFALCDDVAPFIVINHQEAKTARSYTLIHELTHLFLGQTGISNSFNNKRVEKFCDQVASLFLLPHEDLIGNQPDVSDFDALKEFVTIFASDRRISNLQVAYRLLDAGYITRAAWRQLSDFYVEQWNENRRREKEKNKERDVRINPNVVRRSYLGGLVDFVQRMNGTGTISTTKAAVVLGVKPLRVNKLFDAALAT